MRRYDIPEFKRDPINHCAERWPNAFAAVSFGMLVIGGLCALAFGLTN